MAFSQPAPPVTDELDGAAHERLSILAQHAVDQGKVDDVRLVIEPGLVEYFDQFCRVHASRTGRDRDKQLAALAAAEHLKMQARDAAKRRVFEEQAAERGHVTTRILDCSELFELKQPRHLVPHVAYTGAVGVLLGDSQTGKTWVMLSIAAALATGVPWPSGTSMNQPEPVLYVAAEDGGSIGLRLKKWEQAFGKSLRDAPFHVHPSAINLLDEVQIDELCEAVSERGYKLVVFDTVSSSLAGEEEGNAEFAKMVAHMRKIVQAMKGQGCVFLVHHFGKDKSKGARGGSSLYANIDIEWQLKGTLDAMEMENTKWKVDAERKPWYLKLDTSDPDAVHIRQIQNEEGKPVVIAKTNPHGALVQKIILICRERASDNQGMGPNRNAIKGALQAANFPFNNNDISPAIENLVSKRILTPTAGGPGTRGAVYYRAVEHDQMELSEDD